jgi:hypothetical protein
VEQSLYTPALSEGQLKRIAAIAKRPPVKYSLRGDIAEAIGVIAMRLDGICKTDIGDHEIMVATATCISGTEITKAMLRKVQKRLANIFGGDVFMNQIVVWICEFRQKPRSVTLTEHLEALTVNWDYDQIHAFRSVEAIKCLGDRVIGSRSGSREDTVRVQLLHNGKWLTE